MNIKDVSQFVGVNKSGEIQKQIRSEKSLSAKKVSEDKKAIKDEAKISDKGKAFLNPPDLKSEIRKISEELKAVDPEKIKHIRQKIADGFYERPEVTDRIALALSGSPAFGDFLVNYAKANELVMEAKNLPDVDPAKVDQARERKEQGFYTKAEVIETVARKLKKLM